MNSNHDQPWNKGRAVGPRKALTQAQVREIHDRLGQLERWHDQCLFTVAVDTMLRASDLLRLRVCDLVHGDAELVQHFHLRQEKTGEGVAPILTATSMQAVERWLEFSGKEPSDFLFTRDKHNARGRISIGYYRYLVKQWVALIGLPPDQFSSHSLRRTKPKFLFANGVPIETIALLMCHRSSVSTMRYLGLDQDAAHDAALTYDIFGKGSNSSSKRDGSRVSGA